MKRKDRVLSALSSLAQIQIQSAQHDPACQLGVNTFEIAAHARIARTNCSAELNGLCRTGVVVKIHGRPTRYWPADLKTYLSPSENRTENKTGENDGSSASGAHRSDDPFSRLVGSSRSLREAVNNAKIAVSYPPHGMHTLILGEAGVGKSTFAKTMHEYAVDRGILPITAPFVAFNCAEYSNNPEILMDHLFGHVRGAYTGASGDKQGLVEVADGGLLFLDEIHRLPPQGQEMLFHWLDSGIFRRMGEVGAHRQSKALLVVATTDGDENALLRTFRRRIPVSIRMPNLPQWGIQDRYELIYQSLREEAETLGRPLCLTGPAVDKLLFANFPGNIGGLRNALKLACARAYAFDNQKGELVIERKHVQVADVERITMISGTLFDKAREIHVKPTDAPLYGDSLLLETSLYGHLSRLGDQLQEIGFAHDEIVIAIERELVRKQYPQMVQNSLDELRHLIGTDFYEWMEHCWESVAGAIDNEENQAAFIRVCVHLYGSTREGKEVYYPISESIFRPIYHEYPTYCAVAEKLLHSFSAVSGLQLPDYEVPLIALLLKQTAVGRSAKVGVVIMLRGEGIATHMAQTVQPISVSVNIVSLNIPLDATDEWAREQGQRALQLADNGYGAIVMTDMPSIRHWATSLPKIRCVYRPDLTMIFETIIAVESGVDMGEWADRATQIRASAAVGEEVSGARRKIWTTCLTGRGTAMALKRMIENSISDHFLHNIDIIPVEVNPDGEVTEAPDADVMVIIGSVRPNIPSIPFLSVEELLAPKGMERLKHIIGHIVSFQLEWQPTSSGKISADDKLGYIRAMLEMDLRLVNPRMAMQAAATAFSRLQTGLQGTLGDDFHARFALHMAYAVERAVENTVLDYPNAHEVKAQMPILWGIVENALSEFEDVFRVDMPPEEVAFVCAMLQMHDQEENQTDD